jgi:heat shock protein beta
MLWKTLLITFLLASASLFVVAEDAKEAAAPAAATEEAPKAVGEKFEFQAEVSRLMDIIINSLYTNREIFIRELISNAADAMDKIRFQALTDKSLLGEGDAAELDVKIRADKEKKTLTITDKGLGMTKEELIKNLGIVARSGTSEFVEAAAKGADSLSLIGQFGVGFYSVYLVADKVTVHSKSNNDDQYIWESTADSTFTITKDPEGNTIPRGTRITLHLKEDAEEYLSDTKLKELVAKYSQFINFPISVHSVKKEESEVVDEEATAAAKAKAEEERTKKIDEKKAAGEEVNEDDFPVEEVKNVMKKVSHDIDNWEVVNSVKAIWTRAPADITEEQYQDFYKSLTKDSKPYLDQMHFTAEGEITFKSILYIPSEAEAGLYDKFYEKNAALKLYVRRVLITDDFKDFIPRYMNFVKGVVDSDDLPLNVNRETLAQSRVLKVMSKKITRKVIEMLRKLASDSKKINEEAEEQQKEWNEEDKNDPITAGTTDEEKEASEKKRKDREAARKEKIDARKVDKYTKFWNQFGKSLKLGLLDDRSNKNKLVKLIRFETSKSQGKLVGFEEYVDRMKEKQKNIYYLTGENMEQIKKSPFLEQAMRKDIEVIYFDDSLDEYVVQSLPEYEGNTLQSLTKEGLTFGDEKKKLKAKQEEVCSSMRVT